jgi:hypothetical protein
MLACHRALPGDRTGARASRLKPSTGNVMRGILIIAVIALGIGIFNWVSGFWRTAPPPAPPRPAGPPPQTSSFTGTVYRISRVTRGSSFSHYELSFSQASNGQDKLSIHKAIPEDTLKPVIGDRVDVTCMRLHDQQSCYYLLSLTHNGREVYAVEKK